MLIAKYEMLNDKHDNVHFQQKLQYIYEGQFLR